MATGIKEVDVWAAADALLHGGEQPTIERVRLHLGRGSPNTVGPHLKTWFRSLSPRLLGGQGDASDIPQAVTRAVAQVWEVALATARDEWAASVALERTELAQARAELEGERAALAQERDHLRAREADLQTSARAAHTQAAAAETRLRVAEEQVRESTQALKAVHDRLAAAQDQVATLQQALPAAQAVHRDALAAAESRHATHEQRWLREIDEHRQAAKRVQDDLERARKAADAAVAQHRQTIEQARAATEAQAQRVAKAEATIQALTVQLEAGAQAARAAQAHWDSTAAQLTAQAEALRGQVQIKDRQLELLMQTAVRHPAPPPAQTS